MVFGALCILLALFGCKAQKITDPPIIGRDSVIKMPLHRLP